MLLLPAARLPEGSAWSYELKLDGPWGSRPPAKFVSGRATTSPSTPATPVLSRPSPGLPDETVIDGEVVALMCSTFLVLGGRDVVLERLPARKELLER
jgi:hypothetical protein